MSSLLGSMASALGMSEAVWERHANPWSGWTRAPMLPAFVFAIFWREELGVLFWPVLIALLFWVWLNPRVFPVPASTDNWMSRAVMGERVWLNRGEIPVPNHYQRAIPVILAIAVTGLPLMGLGLWFGQIWPLIMGLALSLLGKFWFLDRMVWLYDDMSARHPIYKAWLRQA